MEEYFTFQRCVEYIEDIKERTLFKDKKGSEADLLQEKARKNKVYVAVSGADQAIILPVGQHYHVLRFSNDRFFGEKGLRTLKRYQKDEYRITCHQMSVPDFLSWFDESRFFSEEVSIADKDAEILQKYQIEVPKAGKTTRRYIKEAYIQAISPDKKEEKPKEVAQIVEKYCKPSKKKAVESVVALKLEKTFDEKDEERIEIRGQDGAVFTKYGINVGQKTSYKDIKVALEKVNTQKTFTLKTISKEDFEVFKKYGISFTPTGEAVGRVKPPKYWIPSWKIVAIALLCLILIAGVVWRLWGDQILFAVDDFIHKQKNKLAVKRHLDNLKEQHQALEGKIAMATRLHDLMKQEYPLPARRDAIPQSIVVGLQEGREKQQSLKALITLGEEMVKQKEYGQALRELENKGKPEPYEKNIQDIEKTYRELREFASKSVREDMGGLRDYLASLQEKNRSLQTLQESFVVAYPVAEDYLQPHPIVLEAVTSATEEAAALQNILSEGENLLQEGKFPEALKWLAQHLSYPEIHQKELKILERACARMQELDRMNRELKAEFLRTEKVQSTIRNIRNYILKGGEWLDALDEKTALLQAQYPYAVERISTFKEILTALAARRKEIDQMEKVALQIDEFISAGAATGHVDHKKIEVLVQPYFSLELSELEKFRGFEVGLEDTLKALEMLDKKDRASDFENMITALRQRRANMESALTNARQRLKEAQNIPTDFNLVVPTAKAEKVFNEADQEIRMLQENMDRASQPGEDVKQLKEHLETLTSPDCKTVRPELEGISQDLAGLLQTAETLKIKRTAQAREFSDLRVQAQKQLSLLSSEYENLEKEAESLQKTFPQKDGFPLSDSKYQKKVKSAADIKIKLGDLIRTAEDSWRRQDLESAHKTLTNNASLIAEAEKLVTQVQGLRKDVKARLSASKKEQKRQKKLERSNRILGKMERYTQRLANVLEPVEKDAVRLAQEFPASQGYPYLTADSQKILEEARQSLDSYREMVGKARESISKEKLDEALETLKPYEGKTLSDSEFLEELQTLQKEVETKLYDAEIYRKNKEKSDEVSAYFTKVCQRRDELKQILPQLKQNLQQLERYATLSDLDFPPDTHAFVKDGEIEVKDLDSLIVEAEQLMRDHRYHDAGKLLAPYIKSRDITVLPLLQTLLKNSEKALKTVGDPEARKKFEAKVKEREERERRLKQFSRPPGPWYQEVDGTLGRYEKIGPQLANALEDYGSWVVYSEVEIQIRKMREYPQSIAELDDMLYAIQAKGQKIEPAATPFRQEIFQGYLNTKTIKIDIAEEIKALQDSTDKLEEELRMGGWVENNEPLKALLSNLQAIDRKYNENYQIIRAPLVNTISSLPN